MRKPVAGLFAALATVAFAGTAGAQICASYPSSDRGFYFGARADFPENTDSYGVEANYNFSGPLGVYAGLNVISAEDAPEDAESLDELYAGVALEAPTLGLMIGPRVSACAVGELRNISEDGYSVTQIPLGLGIGGSLGLPVGPEIAAYVQPQIVFSRVDIGEAEGEFDNDFAVKAGATVGLGIVTVGAEARRFFVEGSDFTFGVRVGIAL